MKKISPTQQLLNLLSKKEQARSELSQGQSHIRPDSKLKPFSDFIKNV